MELLSRPLQTYKNKHKNKKQNQKLVYMLREEEGENTLEKAKNHIW